MDERMRDLTCERLQLDEIWGFVGKKQRHLTKEDNPLEMGDTWTFVALDADTKLVPCYWVGKLGSKVVKDGVSEVMPRMLPVSAIDETNPGGGIIVTLAAFNGLQFWEGA